ncbi:MAG: eukaryotic-like serine/threonine-protein kinase, partial [Kribbellaceae bacterium]|nr:eukaryotic-like serine/threonine-protein kinase [Kribbellaceae bacterium]
KWLETLQALDVRRSRAFATLDPTVLNSVYVPGSSPWSADRELLSSYRKQQLRIEGLRLQIQSVTVETPGTTTVVLRVVDRFVAGAAVTPTGQRTTFPPGKPTTRRVTLTAAAKSWRISAIAEA